MADITPASVSAAHLRKSQLRLERLSYEALRPEDLSGPHVADRTLEVGWTQANYPVLRLSPPVDWEHACGTARTWSFLLHAWEPLGPVLATYDRTRKPRYLEFALSLARDWIEAHTSLSVDSAFAWYPMAIGLRAYRLAYIVDALARIDDGDDADIELLLGSVELHRIALADDERFASHTNHGFTQAAGQLAMARRLPTLPGMGDAQQQGRERVRSLLAEHFTSEGAHREHSPAYHHAVLVTLQRILESGLMVDDELSRTRDRIEEALAWLLLPDGTLVPFGDTDAGFRPAPIPASSNPHLRYVTSRGTEGAAPDEMVKVFNEGGYAICRLLDRDRHDRSSYLAQMCGFHSRTHKHADHLTIVWQERGRDLVVDAGRYGYEGRLDPASPLAREGFWYSHPNRLYVESTRAHNTVEIDGESFPRQGVIPFGSALGRHGVSDRVAYVESQVRHPNSVVHTRLLAYAPDRWLVVFDTLRDGSDGRHRYAQRFHFGPDLELERLNDGFGLRLPGEARRLYVCPLLPAHPLPPARGDVEPGMLGWASRGPRTMTPIWTAGYEMEDCSSHSFATLLALGDARPIPDHSANRTNVTGRKARLAWRIGHEHVQVDFDRERAELELRVRSHSVRTAG
jgi:Heparinase II/III-like protein/Heparinase II/III N-terminus